MIKNLVIGFVLMIIGVLASGGLIGAIKYGYDNSPSVKQGVDLVGCALVEVPTLCK